MEKLVIIGRHSVKEIYEIKLRIYLIVKSFVDNRLDFMLEFTFITDNYCVLVLSSTPIHYPFPLISTGSKAKSNPRKPR